MLKAVHASVLPSAQILSVWSFGFVVCLFTVSVIVLWSVSVFPLSVSILMSSIFSSVICFAMSASAIQLWISHSGCFCSRGSNVSTRWMWWGFGGLYPLRVVRVGFRSCWPLVGRLGG